MAFHELTGEVTVETVSVHDTKHPAVREVGKVLGQQVRVLVSLSHLGDEARTRLEADLLHDVVGVALRSCRFFLGALSAGGVLKVSQGGKLRLVTTLHLVGDGMNGSLLVRLFLMDGAVEVDRAVGLLILYLLGTALCGIDDRVSSLYSDVGPLTFGGLLCLPP